MIIIPHYIQSRNVNFALFTIFTSFFSFSMCIKTERTSSMMGKKAFISFATLVYGTNAYIIHHTICYVYYTFYTCCRIFQFAFHHYYYFIDIWFQMRVTYEYIKREKRFTRHSAVNAINFCSIGNEMKSSTPLGACVCMGFVCCLVLLNWWWFILFITPRIKLNRNLNASVDHKMWKLNAK